MLQPAYLFTYKIFFIKMQTECKILEICTQNYKAQQQKRYLQSKVSIYCSVTFLSLDIILHILGDGP